MAVYAPNVWIQAPNYSYPDSNHYYPPYFAAQVMGSRTSLITSWAMEQMDFYTTSPYWWQSTITGFIPTPGSKSNFDTITTDSYSIPYAASFYQDAWWTEQNWQDSSNDHMWEQVERGYYFNGFDIKYMKDWWSVIRWFPEDFVYQEYNYSTQQWESWAGDPNVPYPNSKDEIPGTYQVSYAETTLADGKVHRYDLAQGSWINEDGSSDYYAEQCFRGAYGSAKELYAYQQCSFVSLEVSGTLQSYLDSPDPSLWDGQDPTRIYWHGFNYVNNYSITPAANYTVNQWGYITPPPSMTGRTFSVSSMPDWGGTIVQQDTVPPYTNTGNNPIVNWGPISIPYTDFLAVGKFSNLTEDSTYFAPGWNWYKLAYTGGSFQPKYTYTQPSFRLIPANNVQPPLRMIQRQDSAWPSPHPSPRMNRQGTGGLSTSIQYPGTPRIVQRDGSGNFPGGGGSYA